MIIKIKDTEYNFGLTHKAKIVLEDMQGQAIANLNKSEDGNVDVASILKNPLLLEIMGENSDEVDQKAALSIITASIDAYDVAFAILRNNKDHRGMERETFDNLIEELESELGLEKMEEKIVEVREKAFTLMDSMNKKAQMKIETRLGLKKAKK